MKNRQIIFMFAILGLAIIVGGTVYFIVNQSPLSPLSSVENLPKSKAHTHVSSTGKVIEHVHIYDPPVHQNDTKLDTSSQSDKATDYMKWNKVQRAWSQLDLAEIKRKWQPYTIAEMHEMWAHLHTLTPDNYPNAYASQGWDVTDQFYPRDEWLQRYMDLGHPLEEPWHYRTAITNRRRLEKHRKKAEESPEGREWVFSGYGLPVEATWEELEDTFIKHQVLSVLAHDEYVRQNPDSEGGVFTIDSGFLPFKPDTVYVHVSDDGPVSHFIGPTLTKAEEDAITMFGIAPRGTKVVYTDKNGIPLPPDVKPRFYERAMAQLDAAEKQVAKQIADHDALFNQAENETQQETKPIVADTQHNHPHPHEEADPTRTTQNPGTQQKTPPQVGKNIQPPLPLESPSPDQVQKWFEELILLHGGDLPKDLKALQEIIKELEGVRKLGTEKLPKPLERSAPPARPTSPETPSEQ